MSVQFIVVMLTASATNSHKIVMSILEPVIPPCATHILVVDDSRDTVRHLAEYLLPRHGYRTSFALNGQDALTKIRAEKPDLVILDLNLPELTGLDVLTALANEECPPAVVLMTGYGSEKSAVEAFRLGAKDYLVKPFTMEEVLVTVRRVLAERAERKGQNSAENPALHTAIQRQKDELLNWLDASQTLGSLTDRHQIVDSALRLSLRHVESDSAILWLYAPDQPPQSFIYTPHSARVQLPQPTWRNPYLDAVLETRQPVREASFSGDIVVNEAFAVRALLYVPVMAGQELVGVLGVHYQTTSGGFSQQDQERLGRISSFTGMALRHAFTVEALQRTLAARSRELDTLTQITHNVTTDPQVERVLHAALEHIYRVWHIDACSLWLLDKTNTKVRFFANAGVGAEGLSDTELRLGEGFIGHVVATGRWFYSNAVAQHPLHYREIDERSNFVSHSILCIPLIYHYRVLGALELVNKLDGEFTPQDVEQITSSSALLAVAAYNLREASNAANERL